MAPPTKDDWQDVDDRQDASATPTPAPPVSALAAAGLSAANVAGLGMSSQMAAFPEGLRAAANWRDDAPAGLDMVSAALGKFLEHPVDTFQRARHGFEDAYHRQEALRERAAAEHPYATVAGGVAGGLPAMPQSAAQAAGLGVFHGAGATKSFDPAEAAKQIGTNATLSTLGFGAPLSTAVATGAYALAGDGTPDEKGTALLSVAPALFGAAASKGSRVVNGLADEAGNFARAAEDKLTAPHRAARAKALQRLTDITEDKTRAAEAVQEQYNRLLQTRQHALDTALDARGDYFDRRVQEILEGRQKDRANLNDGLLKQLNERGAEVKRGLQAESEALGKAKEAEALANYEGYQKGLQTRAQTEGEADKALVQAWLAEQRKAGKTSGVTGGAADGAEPGPSPYQVQAKFAQLSGLPLERLMKLKAAGRSVPETPELGAFMDQYRSSSEEMLRDPAAWRQRELEAWIAEQGGGARPAAPGAEPAEPTAVQAPDVDLLEQHKALADRPLDQRLPRAVVERIARENGFAAPPDAAQFERTAAAPYPPAATAAAEVTAAQAPVGDAEFVPKKETIQAAWAAGLDPLALQTGEAQVGPGMRLPKAVTRPGGRQAAEATAGAPAPDPFSMTPEQRSAYILAKVDEATRSLEAARKAPAPENDPAIGLELPRDGKAHALSDAVFAAQARLDAAKDPAVLQKLLDRRLHSLNRSQRDQQLAATAAEARMAPEAIRRQGQAELKSSSALAGAAGALTGRRLGVPLVGKAVSAIRSPAARVVFFEGVQRALTHDPALAQRYSGFLGSALASQRAEDVYRIMFAAERDPALAAALAGDEAEDQP